MLLMIVTLDKLLSNVHALLLHLADAVSAADGEGKRRSCSFDLDSPQHYWRQNTAASAHQHARSGIRCYIFTDQMCYYWNGQ